MKSLEFGMDLKSAAAMSLWHILPFGFLFPSKVGQDAEEGEQLYGKVLADFLQAKTPGTLSKWKLRRTALW